MPAEDEQERQQRQIERVLAESDQAKFLDGSEEGAIEIDLQPDRTRRWSHVNLSRMRRSWDPEDRVIMEEIYRVTDRIIMDRFLGAYDLMDRLFMKVREPVMTGDEAKRDATGRPVYKRNEAGFFIESWTLLTDQDRDNFLWEISTHLFYWEQEAVKLWGDAMFAKGLWEQAFAGGYLGPPGKLTIDDRTQHGHLDAAQDRFFGIFQSVLSRRAEAIVRSMRSIERRLARD